MAAFPPQPLPPDFKPLGASVSGSALPPPNSHSLDALLSMTFRLRQQLSERDSLIHDLNSKALAVQQFNTKKKDLKKGFSVIEPRSVDTSSVEDVLRMSMQHLMSTVSRIFGCAAGVIVLDVPFFASINAGNQDLKRHLPLSVHWEDTTSLSQCLRLALEDLSLYQCVIGHRVGETFSDMALLAELGARPSGYPADLRALMACPIVADNQTIAVVLVVNGECTPGDASLLTESLTEVWTSNVQPLVNIALEQQRKKDTEAMLVQESFLRDEIILSLDAILDEAVKQSFENSHGRVSSEGLWKVILQRVADFFEEFYGSDILIAVTNTEANFRLRTLSNAEGSRKGSTELGDGMEFLHYVFSEGIRKVRRTRYRSLNHPKLRNAPAMRRVLASGKPLFTDNLRGLKFPPGHMKMNSLLVVPILFCDEPVSLLGLANGHFSVSTGRILQSVFTTFWSMIVKATIMSESQKALNAALPVLISDRVKRDEKVADSYAAATVLFADIVGFTEFTSDLEPIEVVEFSNIIFAKLDEEVLHHGLEKIKVIGDCYMVAGGLLNKTGRADPAPQGPAAAAAQAQMREMLSFAVTILKQARVINKAELTCSERIREKLRDHPLQFRVGVGAGPLTAGVFGKGKVQYDVFGSTVNLASRLEHNGRPGYIHVNQPFYDALKKEGYLFEQRDPIFLKGIGTQQTYFCTRIPEDEILD